jgi:hypothetical protein
MVRDREWVTVTLHLSVEEHRKLKRKKAEKGMTWEEYVLSIAGIDDE